VAAEFVSNSDDLSIDGSSFTGDDTGFVTFALLNISFNNAQDYFNDIESSIQAAFDKEAASDALLNELKSQSNFYFFATGIELHSADDTDAISVEAADMCSKCDPNCVTCFGPSASECLTCAEGSVRNGNTCVEECPSNLWHDTDDDVCKAAGCEYGQYLEDNAGGGDVVLTSDTGALVTKVEGFQYLTQGAIESVTPSSGQLGTNVALSGTSLYGGGSLAVSVTIGGANAVIESQSDTNIVVSAGDAPAGASEIVITSNTGATVSLYDGFEYLEKGVINAVEPNNGVVGTRITVSGERLRGGGDEVVSVELGGVEAEITGESDDSVTIVAKSGSAGAGDVVLTAESGATVILADGWNYVDAVDDSLEPSSGQGGTVVQVFGSNLLGGGSSVERVVLAGHEATLMSPLNDFVLKFMASHIDGAQAPGPAVAYMDSGAIVTTANTFTYLSPGFVTSVTPATGHEGTRVTVRGANLLAGGLKTNCRRELERGSRKRPKGESVFKSRR
jgi:hypothetical protein